MSHQLGLQGYENIQLDVQSQSELQDKINGHENVKGTASNHYLHPSRQNDLKVSKPHRQRGSLVLNSSSKQGDKSPYDNNETLSNHHDSYENSGFSRSIRLDANLDNTNEPINQSTMEEPSNLTPEKDIDKKKQLKLQRIRRQSIMRVNDHNQLNLAVDTDISGFDRVDQLRTEHSLQEQRGITAVIKDSESQKQLPPKMLQRGLKLLSLKHPLKKTPVQVTLPYLKLCSCCCNKAGDVAHQLDGRNSQVELSSATQSQIKDKRQQNSQIEVELQSIDSNKQSSTSNSAKPKVKSNFGPSRTIRQRFQVMGALDEERSPVGRRNTIAAAPSYAESQSALALIEHLFQGNDNLQKDNAFQALFAQQTQMQQSNETQNLQDKVTRQQDEPDSDEEQLQTLFHQLQYENYEKTDSQKQASVQQSPDQDFYSLKTKQMSRREIKDKLDENPFLKYGIGIQSYFNLLVSLIKLWAFLSLLAVAQMAIYSSVGGIEQDQYASTLTQFYPTVTTFGNMGYSGSSCSSNFVDWSQESTSVHLRCQGTTKITNMVSSGVTEVTGDSMSVGDSLQEFNRCNSELRVGATVNHTLMDTYLADSVDAQVLQQCAGQQTCSAQISNNNLGVPLLAQRYNQLVYVQATCEQNAEELLWKNNIGLVVGGIGIFMCWVYQLTLSLTYRSAQLNGALYDMQLITASDYTVCGQISRGQYQRFLDGLTPGQRENAPFLMEDMVQKAITEHLTELKCEPKFRKIADVVLSFKNAKIISLLEARANKLKKGDFEAAQKIETELHDYKNTNLAEIRRPVYFYCTFHHEHAQDVIDEEQIELLGERVYVKRAPEVTDIIWENREVQLPEKTMRWMCVGLVMIVLFAIIVYTMMVTIKMDAIWRNQSEMNGSNCETMIEDYGDSLKQFAYRESLEISKSQEQEILENGKVVTVLSRYGTLFCFCENGHNEGLSLDTQYKVKDLVGNPLNYAICQLFDDEFSSSVTFKTAVPLIFAGAIVLVNFTITKIYIWISKYIRLSSHSRRELFIMVSVFFVAFFNYGWLYMAATWDFGGRSETRGNAELGDAITNFDGGNYNDFTTAWFYDIGQRIRITMTANLFVPVFEFFIDWLLLCCRRTVDQRSLCPCNKSKSRAKTVQHFTEVYSGGEFEMHLKLAHLVMMNYCAFLHGPGMPVLFILAFVYTVLHYTVERLSMAYFYRKPPMYSGKITEFTLRLLRFSPLLYTFMALNLFSNQQVFRNVPTEIVNIGDIRMPDTKHQFKDIFSQLTPATPFLANIVFWAVYQLIRSLGFAKKFDSVASEENKPITNYRTFYQVLKKKTREFWIHEEVVASEKYAMKRMSTQNFFQLANLKKKSVSNTKSLSLQGVHNYDILSNQLYQDRLLYVPAVYPQRAELAISQSEKISLRTQSVDLVRLCIDLAYLPESKARDLDLANFDKVPYLTAPGEPN